ncbi:MAG: SUMF1/EgtB/PvdO family nonheme iron enzyme [Deltaproteobacteria bacterium]|nr:SUMF1/EgtB/PvdO family nonheme iron enzyme [Deltaproteobacteria bacterium]
MVYPGRTRNKAVRWEQLPVTAVSAIDAEAYLAWLRQTGQVPGARLCSELEWERAARGAGAREYPHGDRLLPAEANYDLTYDKVDDGMGPDEVGSHPASDSPFGVQDLAGNAFEWTTSALTQGGYVARGGSFFYDASTARTPNRTTLDAAFRDVTLGLRVCTSGTHRPSDETPR